MLHFLPLRVVSAACLVALAACATDGVRLTSAPLHPQVLAGRGFDGHWVVDVSRSEDPDASPGTSGSGRGGGMSGGHGHGGGGMGGGGGGMGGMGGGGRHGGGGGAGAGGGNTAGGANTGGGGNGEMMRRALLLPNTLDIAIQPGHLSIAPDGHPRSVPMVTPTNNEADTTRAGWDGDDLVVIVHGDDKRGDIVQRYTIAPDHSRLVVTTEFKRRSKTVSVVREFTATAAPKLGAAP